LETLLADTPTKMPQRTDVEKLADSETAGTQIITFSTTTKKLVE
jgi:hypothetical protein